MISFIELPFPKKKGFPTTHILVDDLRLDSGTIIPKGTDIKISVTENFGWVVLPVNCKDKKGEVVQNRIYKY